MSKLGEPDDLADRGIDSAAPALTRLAKDINAYLANSPTLQDAADGIYTLLMVDVGELIQAIADETLLGDLQGRLSVETEDLGKPLSDFSNVQPDEAIAFFKSKKLMSAKKFKALQDVYKQRAFAIAGLSNQHAISSAHGILLKALQDGTPQKQVVKDLTIYTSESIPNYAEIVFRNNVIGAYQHGRWQQLQRTKARRPYWQYVTAGDDRVRPDHVAMNGKVFPADSSVWDQWYPPNGHQCRCSIISVSETELKRDGLSVDTELPDVPKTKPPRKARPDNGWSTSPATSEAGDKAAAKHRAALAKMKMLEPPKVAKSGSRAYSDAGALGIRDIARKVAIVDRFAGITKKQAVALGSKEPAMVGKLRRLKAGDIEARVPVASQYADGTDQLLRRLAAEQPTAGMIGTLAIDGQATFAPAAKVAGAELVSADGILRGTDSVISLVARNAEDAQALAASVLNAEAGHGAPIRRAVDAANIIIRGKVSPTPGYTKATLNYRKLGSKQEIRITKKPLKGFTSESILVTIARAKGLN